MSDDFKYLYIVSEGKKKSPGHLFDEKTRTTLCGHPFGILVGAKIYANRDEGLALCNDCQQAYKVYPGTKWTEWEKASLEHKDVIPTRKKKNATLSGSKD